MTYLPRLLVLLCFVLILTNSTSAQKTGSIRGQVIDSTTTETLAYGNVFIESINRGASTDARGYFLLRGIPAGKTYQLKVSYVGYQTKTVDVFVQPDKITDIKIHLASSAVQMQQIEKIGKRIREENETDVGLERLTIKEIEMLPKSVETDLLRSLQNLPGVRTTGDVSAKYYVQGGSGDQNLILINGATLYNPFHALGLFSVVDPDLIKTMEFSKGGFTSEYGGRVSSVLKLITKEGNKNQLSAKASASLLTAKTMISGPIPDGSFIVTARKSYSQQVLKKFVANDVAPFDFYDVSFKLNYLNNDFVEDGKFYIHGFFSGDDLDHDDPFKEDFSWRNNLFGVSWFQVYDNLPFFSELSLTVSNFEGKIIPNYSTAKLKENSMTDINFKMDMTYMFENKNELGLGFNIKGLDNKLLVENIYNEQTAKTNSGAKLALYAKYKFLAYEWFGLDIGSRFNALSIAEQNLEILEPRISMTLRPNSWLRLQAAWGFYQQEVATVSDENEVIALFEPWVVIPPTMEPTRSVHYVGAAEIDLGNLLNFRVEGYYKYTRNLPIINDNRFDPSLPDIVPGTGESYGWDFRVRSTIEPFSFTGSYSLAWAYKVLDDWRYYPKYDSRHNVNLTLEADIGYGWTASIMWLYHTGLPFTENMGYYMKWYFSDLRDRSPFHDQYYTYALLADKNLGRLPDYHRMDFNVSKEFELLSIKYKVDFSIMNVYDRNNIFYFKRDTGERVNMLPFLPSATISVEL